MTNIKLLVMDVDGTLTDGKIYMGEKGEIAKAFDVKDGCGIALILPRYAIIPVIITARRSKIVENRCEELGIKELHQGAKNKLETLFSVIKKYNVELDSVAYIGDDLPDIPCMDAVKKAGGLVMCPSNAIPEICAISDFISSHVSGDGAIRDCITYIVDCHNVSDIENRIRRTIEAVQELEMSGCDGGIIEEGITYTVQEYDAKNEDDCVIECHRNHIDVQYIIEGCEEFVMYDSNGLVSSSEYDQNKDVELWESGIVSSRIVLVPGSFVVVYNGHPHKGAILCGTNRHVRKIICKIEI